MRIMNNYQLYRTNVLLGGQVQWNISIKNIEGELNVCDFYLSPIHDSIRYSKQQHSLNYTHQSNVKTLYHNIKGNFYKPVVNSRFVIWEPVYCEDSSLPKTIEEVYCNEYEMGCKRSNYSVTGYQYQFFCPVWLERCKNISVYFHICSIQGDPIYTKEINLTGTSGEYHNKFSKYLNDYLDYAGLKQGDDKVMYVDPKDSQMHGLCVDNPGIINISLPNLYDDLTAREIPLMEFDNIIMSCFESKRLITKQLFNFNFLFNIEDLLPENLYEELLCKKFMIKTSIKVDGEVLQIKDFYSNYDYIPRQECGKYNDILISVEPVGEGGSYDVVAQGSDNMGRHNVLDYLKDHTTLNLIDKNKFSQDICHWSMRGNNDYIFNFYKGFGGVFSSDGVDKFRNYYYGNSPDLKYSIFNNTYNNAEWCNIIRPQIPDNKNRSVSEYPEINIQGYLSLVIECCDYNKLGKYFSKFGVGNDEYWVKNLKYSPIKSSQSYQDGNNKLELLFVDVADLNANNIEGYLSVNRFIKITDNLYIKYQQDNSKQINWMIGVFDSRDGYDDIVFKKFKENIKLYLENHRSDVNTESLLNKLNLIIPIQQQNIVLKNSLDLYPAYGPILDVNENIYLKSNIRSSGIYRYLGGIKPAFVGSNNDKRYNFAHYKKIINVKKDSQMIEFFDRMQREGFSKKYKSIGYYPLEELELNYEELPMKFFNILNSTNQDEPEYELKDNYDGYKWYNKSIINPLIAELHYHYIYVSSEDNEKDLRDVVTEYLKNYYNVDDHSYILNLYKYKVVSYNHTIIKNSGEVKYQREYDINIILK